MSIYAYSESYKCTQISIPSGVIDNISYKILKQCKVYPNFKLLIGSVNANVYNIFYLEHHFSKNTTCV